MPRHRLKIVLLALWVVATACHGRNPHAQRIIASPSQTPVAGLETPVPSGSAKATTSPSPAPSSRPPPPTPPTTDLASVRTKVTQIASLNQPLAMAIRSGDSDLYIAEKVGTIHAIRSGHVDGTPVLDISTEVSQGSEQGLLGLAFLPDGSRLYVYFTNTTGDIVIREYAFANGRAVTSTARTVLQIAHHTYPNHNGGNLVFGPDGYLYIGVGDGGSEGDPDNNGQNLGTLLAKMLRIDPRQNGSNAYQIPPSNPFVGRSGARDEIWAYGLRNPWRYSFDSITRDLWIADVGQNTWEEIDYQGASSKGGDNYGWSFMEATHSYKDGPPPNHHAPIYEYSHADGNCAVTGGYVYRGRQIPKLDGAYLFADFCVGRLRAFVVHNGRAAGQRFLGPQIGQLSSFGQDASGEVYVMSLAGGVYRIDPA